MKNKDRKIVEHVWPSVALSPQYMFQPYDFPFSCNPVTGCFFNCRYCYLQAERFNRNAEFGKEVKLKVWFPEQLEKDLVKYRDLPQHLKRVQLGMGCECFLPWVLNYSRKKLERDIMREIFEIFRRQWEQGNKWMVHVITKSHMIHRYIEILSAMRHMVQVEISMVCIDEKLQRALEPYTPSLGKRFELVRQLAQAGIFVRIMAMPWLQSKREAFELRDIAFEHGARAFKHKDLNYFDKEVMLSGEVFEVDDRRDRIYQDLLVKSGEITGRGKMVLLPRRKDFGDLVERRRPQVDSGYAELNDVDWGYLV